MAEPDLPNDVPDIDIPDLKKREKERKKAGAAWGKGSAPGGGFQGATGASGAGGGAAGVARGAASAARLAASAARGGAAAVEGLAAGGAAELGFFARLAGTLIGKVVIAAVAALVLGGGAVVAAKYMGYGAAPRGAAPELGGIASSIRVAREGISTALDYAARSSKGQIKFSPTPAPPKTEAPKTDGNTETDKAVPKTEGLERTGLLAGAGDNPQTKDRLAHDLSGAKLSAGLGASFGGKDIFSGGSGAPKFGDGFDRGRIKKLDSGNGKAGRSAKLQRSSARGNRAIAMGRHLKAGNSKSLGQLRGMAPLNAPMRSGTSATETNAAVANEQFEGAAQAGEAPPGPAGASGGTVPSSLPGNVSTPSPGDIGVKCTQTQIDDGWVVKDGVCQPDLGNVNKFNATPWQGQVDSAMQMMMLAVVMLILSAVMWAIADIWFATACSAFVGLIFVALAEIFALVALGAGLMVTNLASQVKNMGGGSQAQGMSNAGLTITIGAALAMVGGAFVGFSAIIAAFAAIAAMVMMALG